MNSLFEENKSRFMNGLSHTHFIIELTKCCNYTEWVVILKNYTLADFYRQVKEILCNQNIRLFVKDEYNNILNITESELSVRQFIYTNSSFFKPVYPLPFQVIYKIHVDDGHNHIH